MQFSNTTDKSGLIQDCEFLLFNDYGKITGNQTLLYMFTNTLNRAYDKAVSIIIANDGRWQHHDSTYTTTMVQTTNIVDGQRAYTLDASHLKVTLVRAKDTSGNWRMLNPIDQNDPTGRAFTWENATATEGDPHFYDKRGDQIILYPIPDENLANGLEITVQRIPNYYVATDSTREAGISPLFHRFLSLDASLQYAVANSLAQKNDLSTMLADETARIKAFYNERSRDEQTTIKSKVIHSR